VVVENPPVVPDLGQATAARVAAEQALDEAIAVREAALLPLRQRLQAARVAFAETERSRKTALVRAPISGTVLALNTRPGQEVSPPQEADSDAASGSGNENAAAPAPPLLATIVDLERLQVHAPISSNQTGAVKPGQPATLTFEALRGQTFAGRVRQITTDPAVAARGGAGALLKGRRATPRQIAIIGFENTQGLVKPDTARARVAITVGEERNALAVPADAVDRDQTGRPIVKVLRGGQWTPVVVEPGLSDGRYTAIRSSSGSGDLREGETIQVTPSLM
jgi:multidrug efflux pump subunit AcrA (membrane-fusion protein)